MPFPNSLGSRTSALASCGAKTPQTGPTSRRQIPIAKETPDFEYIARLLMKLFSNNYCLDRRGSPDVRNTAEHDGPEG
jgi:hypothetical protein